MRKLLSIFVDESGDSGFSNLDINPFYIISFVFHDQRNKIDTYLNKIKNYPVFHVGPLIRRENEFRYFDIKQRQMLMNKLSIFTSIIPIKQKTFIYRKKDFNKNRNHLLTRISKDLNNFIIEHRKTLDIYDQIIIYYDDGQRLVSDALASSFGNTIYKVLFKAKVKPENYRLFQVADFVASVSLINSKIQLLGKVSKSEEKFIDKTHFKKLYLKTIKKKEI